MRRVKETRPITDLTGPRPFIDLTHLDDKPKPKLKTKPKSKPKKKSTTQKKTSSGVTVRQIRTYGRIITATATSPATINKTVPIVAQVGNKPKATLYYDTSAKISVITKKVARQWGLLNSRGQPRNESTQSLVYYMTVLRYDGLKTV